jgi:hypothetical protein
MHYEHLIEINDFANPLATVLTRAQLWAGLLLRVEAPQEFLPGVSACEIVARGDGWLTRRLDFGATAIEDRVTLRAAESVHFEIAASPSHAGGSLTIAIEERGEQVLFLRFTYRTHDYAARDDASYEEYVKSAYRESDIDTVQRIHELAEQGLLPEGLH